MSGLSEREEVVAQHYNGTIFDFEVERLQIQPVEFAITARYLERYVPSGSLVAEVGVGGGRYSEVLARRGCSMHLIDITQRLLDTTVTRLDAAGLGAQVLDVTRASATNLAHLDSDSCDAVLLLGPLYHLLELADREQAVREAAHVLKIGGVLVAAGINRLAYLRDTFRQSPRQGAELRAFHAQFMRDGNLDPVHAPPIAYAHLSTSDEFRALFAGTFEQAAFVGVESFTSVWSDKLHGLPEEDKEAWLDLVEQTGMTPDGIGLADHFLYIGHKRSQRAIRP